MASIVPTKRGHPDDSEDERSGVPSETRKSGSISEKTRRQNKSKRVDTNQSNKLDENEKTHDTENLSPLPDADTLASYSSEAFARQTGLDDRTMVESNMLSELNKAATRIIETHRRSNEVTKKELGALKEELGVVRGELEASKEELEASKEELEASKEESEAFKEESEATKEDLEATKEELEVMKRSRDEALDELDEKKKLVDLSEIHATIYKIEFKSASDELVDAELRLRATRAQNDKFFQDKQKAERGFADLENRAEKAEKMAEYLREELASERARVCEFELKHGVIVL